jgi:hypothetical protein
LPSVLRDFCALRGFLLPLAPPRASGRNLIIRVARQDPLYFGKLATCDSLFRTYGTVVRSMAVKYLRISHPESGRILCRYLAMAIVLAVIGHQTTLADFLYTGYRNGGITRIDERTGEVVQVFATTLGDGFSDFRGMAPRARWTALCRSASDGDHPVRHDGGLSLRPFERNVRRYLHRSALTRWAFV